MLVQPHLTKEGDVPFGECVRQTIQTFSMLIPLSGLRIKFGYALWKLEVS